MHPVLFRYFLKSFNLFLIFMKVFCLDAWIICSVQASQPIKKGWQAFLPFWENDKQTNLFPNIMLDMMAGIGMYYVCTKPCQRSMGPIPPLSTYGFRPMAWEKRKQRIAFCLSKDNVYQQSIDQYCWFWTKDVSTYLLLLSFKHW